MEPTTYWGEIMTPIAPAGIRTRVLELEAPSDNHYTIDAISILLALQQIVKHVRIRFDIF